MRVVTHILIQTYNECVSITLMRVVTHILIQTYILAFVFLNQFVFAFVSLECAGITVMCAVKQMLIQTYICICIYISICICVCILGMCRHNSYVCSQSDVNLQKLFNLLPFYGCAGAKMQR